MVITGYVAFIIFGVIGHFCRRRGHHWVADVFIGLGALAIAGTAVGSWLHDKSNEGITLLANFIIGLFHR